MQKQVSGYDMNICTWVGCTVVATHPQLDRNGTMWANLCLHHHAELSESIATSIPKMVSAWVKAKGGAKKATEAM